jgi:hypothetical protein
MKLTKEKAIPFIDVALAIYVSVVTCGCHEGGLVGKHGTRDERRTLTATEGDRHRSGVMSEM